MVIPVGTIGSWTGWLQFAEKLDYPCKNAHLGCESTFMLKDKEDHEANCAFRFYKCILCPWKGLHRELLPHLMRDHPGKVGHGAEQVRSLTAAYCGHGHLV
ncbi:hypothetical protein PR048_007510 [Dryococelus australis]|uniref:SIAH-type domain-containing protein n=1 Tax=Dryococelus australis TaxID=614101 RepID=A0ABQ9HVC8_9NEOP|nr:hypothetical protein PR048_007510 [Dryococelus australis]